MYKVQIYSSTFNYMNHFLVFLKKTICLKKKKKTVTKLYGSLQKSQDSLPPPPNLYKTWEI